MHFFHAASPSIFSCLVTGNIFFTASCRLACTPHLWPVQKQISFFFLFSIFCRFFLCVFVLLFCCYPHASPLHVIEQDCRCICICVLHLFAFRICFLVPAIRAVNTVELPKKNSILSKMLIFILHKLKMSYVYCVKVEKNRKYSTWNLN